MIKDSPWNKFTLNSLVVKSLVENNYHNPTDIQSHSLPYTPYKTDLILASKTGSGKTLCFAIPILSDLFNELGVTSKYTGETPIDAPKRENLRALVLTPTRELALQIKAHFERINKYTKKHLKIGVLIGGLSKEKQLRILSQNPQILIATPGRLWDMLDQDFNPFLQTLKKINYLVLDEADKMIELGHFKELDKILSFIYSKDKTLKENVDMINNEDESEFLGDLFVKGPGGRMVPLNDPSLHLITDKDAPEDDNVENDAAETAEEDIEEADWNDVEEGDENNEENMEEIDDLENEGNEDGEEEDNVDEDDQEEGKEDDDDDENIEEDELNENDGEIEEEYNEEAGQTRRGKFSKRNKKSKSKEEEEKEDDYDKERAKTRRTIVLSATLATSYDTRANKLKKNKKKTKKQKRGKETDEVKVKGGETTSFKMASLMKKIQFNGKPKLIDLTTESKLPSTLKEYKCLCTDEQKILYLYYFIQKTPDQTFIVFANSIPAAKRVYSVLQKLGVKAACLHSEMQQRQRIKKLEDFTARKSRVLVCTDVASRGLDIPSVNFVIHYQIPRDVDTYVHRSGRTARIGNEGTAYALVGPQDKGNYGRICKELRGGEGLETITLSKSAMDRATEMVEAATKLEHGEFLLQKQQKQKEWFEKSSKQADILIDEDLQDQLDGATEEITKKRKIISNNKVDYQKIKQKAGQRLINPKKSKSVFLDPSEVANIANMLKTSSQKPGKAMQVNHNTVPDRRERSKSRKGRRMK